MLLSHINYLSSLQSPLEQNRGKIRCAGGILHDKKDLSSELDAIITIEKFKSRKSESSLCKCAILQFFSILSLWRAEPGPHLGNGGLCAMSIPGTQIDSWLHGIGKHRRVFRTIEGHWELVLGVKASKRNVWEIKEEMAPNATSWGFYFGAFRMSHPWDPTPIKQS